MAIPWLPEAFVGKAVAVLVDVHHSNFTSKDDVEGVVEHANALRPDLIMLPGDFVHTHPEHIYTRPCIEAMSRLRAPLGVFAVPGNHDHWDKVDELHRCLRDTEIVNLTNTGTWLHLDGARLRLAGIDDLWMGEQDLKSALGDCRANDCCVLMSPNPDFVETMREPRVGLVLSGHTHGGQIVIPGMGHPRLPTRYGTK